MIRKRRVGGYLLSEMDHAQDLIAKRRSLGRKGIPTSVKRYCRRTGQQIPDLLSDTATVK